MIKEKHGGYIYGIDHEVYDFSANLNPLGMPKEANRAIIENIEKYESYPDPHYAELKAAIATYHGVDSDRICCGNGTADIIFRIPLALKPKKALVVSPTFTEYEEALKLCECEITHFELAESEGFVLGEEIVDVIKQEHFDVIFVCNPNNPTGIPVKRESMLKIAGACAERGTVLVADECFADFLEDEESYSLMEDIDALTNVIILKAFTKIFAMAGLRLGYCVCGDMGTAKLIGGLMQPWAVSTVASKAGVAAMQVDGFAAKTKEYVAKERLRLMSGLKELGFKVYDSQANYIFFHSDVSLDEPLLKRDILIRNCSNYRGLPEGYYRIAVRTAEENKYLLSALKEIK